MLGLVVVLLLLSLLASGFAELLEAVVKRRATYLREALVKLVPAPGGKETRAQFVDRLYGHPLIQALYRDTKGPSYIPSKVFALALVSELAKGPDGAGTPALAVGPAMVQGVLGALPRNWKPAEALAALAVQAHNDFDNFITGIAGWYDASMERVSGWYKRYAQRVLLGIGLVLAVTLNADVLSLAQKLAADATLRQSLAAVGSTLPRPDPATPPSVVVLQTAEQLAGLNLPLGWSTDPKDPRHVPVSGDDWAKKLLGLLLTTVAISFGAPFWFDLLGRIVTVRASVKPAPAPAAAPVPADGTAAR